MLNQSTLETLGATRTIEQIRKDGIDKEMLEKIAAERQEMQRIKQEQKERLPGQFLSLKHDKETRTFLFTGNYQKIEVQAKDFVTRQIIPGKMVTKYRFQVYEAMSVTTAPTSVALFNQGLVVSSSRSAHSEFPRGPGITITKVRSVRRYVLHNHLLRSS